MQTQASPDVRRSSSGIPEMSSPHAIANAVIAAATESTRMRMCEG